MTKQYIHRIGFIDGVKPAYNPIAIPRTALWEARNVDVDDIGVLRTRPGSKTVSNSLGLGGVQGAIVAFGGILAAWNGGLYKCNLSTGVWTAVRESFLASGDIPMELWSESGSPVVYLHDGNGLWKTNGSTCDRVTPYAPGTGEQANLLRAADGTQDLTSGIAKGKAAVFKHGLASRMAVAYGNDVFLSAPFDPSYFPANQVFHLPDDGGVVVALRLAYGALIIFRDKDIWAFLGNDVTDAGARLTLQDGSVGCYAAKSIAYVPGVGQVFLGPDNVYTLQGVSAIENQYQAIPIGDDIIPYLRRTMAVDGVGTFYDREYILCFPNAVEPERVFRYKASKKAWYIDTDPRASHYIETGNKLYLGSSTEGVIKERSLSYRTDDGAAIPFLATFAHERISQGQSKVKKIFVYVNSRDTLQHLNASVIGDGKETQTVELFIAAQSGSDFIIGQSGIEVSRIGRVSEVKIYEGNIRVRGTFSQVQIIGTTPNEDIGIIGYSLLVKTKEKMKGIKG